MPVVGGIPDLTGEIEIPGRTAMGIDTTVCALKEKRGRGLFANKGSYINILCLTPQVLEKRDKIFPPCAAWNAR